MVIGKQIKHYRGAKQVTQEELADYLGVSFQAVSKWENDASVPDIALLPKLAVYFGITIDELFKMPNEELFLRIENTVTMEEELDENTFRYFEKFLLDMLQTKERERALEFLAHIYNHRAASCHRRASEYARQVLEKDPESHGGWAAYLEAEGGVCGDDWYDNHFEVIAFIREFLKRHPKTFRGHYALVENLLADGKYEEAEGYVEQLDKIAATNRKYMKYQYLGEIAFGRGKTEEALVFWNKGVTIEPVQWQALCHMGDNLLKIGKMEEAISYYEKSFTIQEEPRLYDGLCSRAQVEEQLGRYADAIATRQRILTCLQEEYHISKGSEINRHKQEIKRLKTL